MTATLTLWPFDKTANAYGAAQTKSLEDWGVQMPLNGSLKANLFASSLDLSFPGAALDDTDFSHRSRIAIALDGKTLFAGYVTNQPARELDANTNRFRVKCQDSLWALDKIVFRQSVDMLKSVVDQKPVWEPKYFTHFTLNAIVTPTFTQGVTNTATYSVEVISSAEQIMRVLDYAKQKGVWIDYDEAGIMDVPVRITDVQNITCLAALRMQFEDVDAAAWLDFSAVAGGGAPKFKSYRRKDLPAFSRALCNGGTPDADLHARAFQLRRLDEMAVSYVQIDFEQQVTVGNTSGMNLVTAVYPDPAPADEFNALITSVPLKPQSAINHQKYIRTERINAGELDWWKKHLPAMDEKVNPNAKDEFADLQFVPGTQPKRQSNLPNMIVDGGTADWMNGALEKDKISAQFNYHRKAASNLNGSKVSAHTKFVQGDVTDLDFPDGILFTWREWTQMGEDITPFLELPKIIYEDLNPANGHWEGSIPLLETEFSGDVCIGRNLNLTNSRAEHAEMNALIQDIGFSIKSGAIFYTINVGPNKTLSPAQLADRLRSERTRYYTAVQWAITTPPATVRLPRRDASESSDEALPQFNEFHVAADDKKSGVIIKGNPHVILQTYDENGNVKNPPDAGMIVLDLAATKGSDGNWHAVGLREVKVCVNDGGVLKQRTAIALVSDIFKGPDDPA